MTLLERQTDERSRPGVRKVNNVGKSYDEPMYFQDLPDQDMIDIVEINVCVPSPNMLPLCGWVTDRHGCKTATRLSRSPNSSSPG